jgi:DNA processing protein
MEAREKSGSLITADMALEQGKDVYALPGPVDSSLSRGCHQLIRQGAGILISPEMLLEEMGISGGNFQEKNAEAKKMLESLEDMVYSSVVLYPRNIGQIMDESGLSAQEVLETLVSLEIKGYVQEVSKNYYVRV